MTTICWTIIHHAAAPVAARMAHTARRIVGPVVRYAARVPHLAPPSVRSAHTWVEVVCKVVPAAIVGGGLLAPHPIAPLRPTEPPPPIVAPEPPTMPWLFPPSLPTTQPTPVQPYPTPAPVEPTESVPIGPPLVEPAPPPVETAPEPSSAGLLLGGTICLLLIRLPTRRTRARAGESAGGSEPGPCQTHLIGRSPVFRTLLGSHQGSVAAGEHQ
jgi:hypothetical protein